MEPIRKKILTDEAHHPVAVQLEYGDWLRIEPLLRDHGLLRSETADDKFDALLAQTSGLWIGGDGLKTQYRLRDEWTRPWDREAGEAP